MTGFKFLIFSAMLPGVLLLLKLYIKIKTKWCTNKVCLVGKVIVVTGANTGIGYETAIESAKRGARVILACRDEGRATQARDKIVKDTGNKNVVVKLVDFSSLESVRNFAKDFVETEERIDVLVNNAGILESEDKFTKDGLQFVMQVNYFGPFLLTLLLIDKLKKSAPSRIVNVSSFLAARTKLDVNSLNTYEVLRHPYKKSKLCNILFTKHLARILEKDNVTVYSVHPGVVYTEIDRYARGLRKYLHYIFKYVIKTPEEGAQTVIYTAVQHGIEQHSGGHFHECKPVKTYATARNPALPKRLWDKTVELLKCEEEVKNL